MPQDPATAQVESGLLIAAANLAAGTGQFSISNDPTLQAADVANAMHMKWEMCRSYYAALVGALGDPKDWTPPSLAAVAAITAKLIPQSPTGPAVLSPAPGE